ncbi:hypothetical protein UFOVP1122_26 [uncultured Caudovirales phage]|uniref:Uncharacterized protein n=1 Tax=uncultured Caudovirales phage TaxID=2100421 RepID=A0A6J5QUV7_9CAUD|nr:hypothetical protein UFOVP1122_26 [uncultured Caudovirales phage]
MIGLREIGYGVNDWDAEQTCIYVTGHIEPERFLEMVRAFSASDVPQEAREALTVDDVQHSRFRPMLPHEARQWGCDKGVMETDRGGYKVTKVIL